MNFPLVIAFFYMLINSACGAVFTSMSEHLVCPSWKNTYTTTQDVFFSKHNP